MKSIQTDICTPVRKKRTLASLCLARKPAAQKLLLSARKRRFRQEFGGVTCRQLQQQFTGRTYDMWDAGEYKAFDDARGKKCAHATATVTKWIVEML